jgi:alpha-amylase
MPSAPQYLTKHLASQSSALNGFVLLPIFAEMLKYPLPLLLMFSCCSCGKDPVPVQIDDLPEVNAWWNDRVFYEIFVRSFYDSNGDGIGDLNGVIQKLDYLNDGNPATDTDLGVTGIWLMPIHPSPSYHGYDITDYKGINGQYGTPSEFKTLIDEAHKRGIKVVIDFVINHTSEQHPWFVNSSSSATSEKRDYYVWTNSNPGYGNWISKNGWFYYAAFHSSMPDLNHRSTRVADEIQSVADFWRTNMNIDGFRVDAAPWLIEEGSALEHSPSTLKWWRDFWTDQKLLDPGFMIVGEVWSSTSNVVRYADKAMDYCFEFDLAGAIISGVNSGNPLTVATKMNEVSVSYEGLQFATFLSNHDQNRVIESLSQDLGKAKLAAATVLSLPGVPYLYYGEEVGMRGVKPDEDIRRPMQWTAATNAGFTNGAPWRAVNTNYASFNVETLKAEAGSLWNLYRKFIHARNSSAALRQGNYKLLNATNARLFAFLRVKDSDAVIAVHNFNSAPQQGQFSVATSALAQGNYAATDLFTGEAIGVVTVEASGKFDNVNIGSSFEGFSSHLVRLTKQ